MDPTDLRDAAYDAADQSNALASKPIDDGAQQLGRPMRSVAHELRNLEDLARRRVWTLAGGALVLGFTTSRLLKTTRARRFRRNGAADAEPVAFGHGFDGRVYAAEDETSFDESTDIGRTRGGGEDDAL